MIHTNIEATSESVIDCSASRSHVAQIVTCGENNDKEKLYNRNTNEKATFSMHDICEFGTDLYSGAEELAVVDPLKVIKNEVDLNSQHDLTIATGNYFKIYNLSEINSCGGSKSSTDINVTPTYPSQIFPMSYCEENANLNVKIKDLDAGEETKYSIAEMCSVSSNVFEAENTNALDPLNLMRNEQGFSSKNYVEITKVSANNIETTHTIADKQSFKCLICGKTLSSRRGLSRHKRKLHRIETCCDKKYEYGPKLGESLKKTNFVYQNCTIEEDSIQNLSLVPDPLRSNSSDNNKNFEVALATNFLPVRPDDQSSKMKTNIVSNTLINNCDLSKPTSSGECTNDQHVTKKCKTKQSNQGQITRDLVIKPLGPMYPQNNLQCDLCAAKVASRHSCIIRIDVCQPCLSKSRTGVMQNTIMILDKDNIEAGSPNESNVSQNIASEGNNARSVILRSSRAHIALISQPADTSETNENPDTSTYVPVLVCPYCLMVAAPTLQALTVHLKVCSAIRPCNICGLKQGATTSCAIEVLNCSSCLESLSHKNQKSRKKKSNKTLDEDVDSVTAINCKKKDFESAEKCVSAGGKSLDQDENNCEVEQNFGAGNKTQTQKDKTVTNATADSNDTTHIKAQPKKIVKEGVLANVSVGEPSQKVVTISESTSNVEVEKLMEFSSENEITLPVELQPRSCLSRVPAEAYNSKETEMSEANTSFTEQMKNRMQDVLTDKITYSQSPSMEVTLLPEQLRALHLHFTSDSKVLSKVIIPFLFEKPPTTTTDCSVCHVVITKYFLSLHEKSSLHNRVPCHICDDSVNFKNNGDLNYHLGLKHTPINCQLCLESCEGLLGLRLHMQSSHVVHSEECIPKETLLTRKVTSLASISSHNNVIRSREYECTICGKNYRSKVSLTSHTESLHLKTDPFLCNMCAQTFADKRKLMKHLHYHEFIDFRGISAFCNRCDYSCTLIQSMARHMLSVHNIRINARERQCKTCGDKFWSHSGLSSHVSRVHDKKKFACKFCNLEFLTRQSRRTHELRSHTNREKTIKCPICSKMFFAEKNLTRHLRTHTGETPYKCSFCDRAFTLTSNLHAHLRLHTGVKPYKCEVCGLAFRHNVSKKNHMKYHKDLPGFVYMPPVINRKYIKKNKKERENVDYESEDDLPLSKLVKT